MNVAVRVAEPVPVIVIGARTVRVDADVRHGEAWTNYRKSPTPG